MNRKHFSFLLFLTFVVAALALVIPGETGRDELSGTTSLLPGLKEQVNEIGWLKLTAGNGQVVATLKRVEDSWLLEEAASYRADWGRLRTLLSDLSQAEILELKTANPDYYDRLGVEDVSAQDANGVMLEFGEETGLPAVIVGKSAQGREGQYVRLREQADSALVDRALDLPTETTQWLDRDIIDVPDTAVVEFEITHPDGERVLARKISAEDENFSLEGIPDGREIKSAWTVNSLANNLSALTLEAVAEAGDFQWGEAVRYRAVTVDGLQVEMKLLAVPAATEDGQEGSDYWIRLEAGVFTTGVESAVEAGTGIDPAKQASEINRDVQGWAYRIPQYKYDSMTKRMQDLLNDGEGS